MKTPLLLKSAAIRFPILFDISNRLGIKNDFEIKTFLKHIRKGDVVWDIGANVGRFTELFCMMTGSHGKVIALEPLSLNFARLIKLKFPHLTCHQMGLSHQAGQATFYYPLHDGAQASLKVQNFGHWVDPGKPGEEICQLDTLDALILNEHWPRPHFIKIDAEGAEYQILQGGRRVLTENSITLFIELNQETLKSFQVTLESLWKLLGELGYQQFTLVGRTSEKIVNHFDDLQAGMRTHFSPSILCRKEIPKISNEKR